MSIEPMTQPPLVCCRVPFATPDRAPSRRLARAGVAAAIGGFDPSGIGGSAASRGAGVQRPVRHVACNIIVGLYMFHWNLFPS